MADNPPLPNFANLSGAFNTVATELSYLENTQPLLQARQIQTLIDQNAQILQKFEQTQQQLQDIKKEIKEFKVDIRKELDEFKVDIRKELDEFKVDIRKELDEFKVDIRKEFEDFENRVNLRFTSVDNNIIRLSNRQKLAADSGADLAPLHDPATGEIIPNYPTTFAAISRLSATDAKNILQVFQVPVPASTSERRNAVLQQLTQ